MVRLDDIGVLQVGNGACQLEYAAKKLGMTRSRLYSAAVADFLNRYRKDDIKAKLNEVHAAGSPGVDPALAAMQFASMPKEEW